MATTNRGLATVPTGTFEPSVPVNAALSAFDGAVYGTTSIEFTTDANLTMTQAQCDASALVLTDSVVTLTAGRDVIFPAHFPLMHVKNSTAQTLTLKKSGQTGVTIAAASTAIVASGATDVEKVDGSGSGASPVGRHMVPVMAAAMAPSIPAGCAALATVASASNQPDIVTLDFDPTTQEYAQFAISMPESWNEGTITFMPIWSHAATTTNFGVVWDLQAVAVSNDDTIAVAYGTAQTSTDTGGTTNDIYIGPESSAITVSGTPAAGDLVFFRLSRVTGNGSDTMAVDARLHGIRLYITTAAATD